MLCCCLFPCSAAFRLCRLVFRQLCSQEMVKGGKLIFSFDATKKARFGLLLRYAEDELQIRCFELPNCVIFHNGEFSFFPITDQQQCLGKHLKLTMPDVHFTS